MVNAAEAYKRQQILTATPEQLTLMLYNGCLKFIGEGIEDVKGKKNEDANTNIIYDASDNIVRAIKHFGDKTVIYKNYPKSIEFGNDKIDEEFLVFSNGIFMKAKRNKGHSTKDSILSTFNRILES